MRHSLEMIVLVQWVVAIVVGSSSTVPIFLTPVRGESAGSVGLTFLEAGLG